MYRTNLQDVPKVGGLKRKDGWVDMQVQFLIDKKSAGADHVVGWTVLKPGARHENHRHHNCDEFFIVLKGKGHIYTENGEQPSSEGDVVYSPRTCWKTSCWCGAGWARAPSRRPATKSIPRRINRLSRPRRRAPSGSDHETLGGSPRRAGHAGATRGAAQAS
jgi:hypothetical protein